MKVYYRPSLRKKARELRRRGTKAEVKLWQHLKGRQLLGFDFHRQKPLGNYIVDFVCMKARLVIEVDGYTHRFESVAENDKVKQRYLENLGFFVVRVSNDDVMGNTATVIKRIEAEVNQRLPGHTPVSPLDRGDA
ncbi:endonuclease domain-containing protein [bacterium]|nr:endonuclease domain-containing protein [bacterium]